MSSALLSAFGGKTDNGWSRCSAKLTAFFDGRCTAFIDVGGKVDKMYTALRFLARFDAYDGQGNLAPKCLAQELLHSQVTEEVTAHLIDRHNGLSVVLRH